MTGFGSALRAERERCDLTLQSISDRTKISIRNLEALEAEDFAVLPSGVFRRGIVRAYVLELGLDEHPWLERFQASHDTFVRRTGISGPEPEAWETFAENVKRGRTPKRRSIDLRWLYLLLMLLALAAAAWATWQYVLLPRIPHPPGEAHNNRPSAPSPPHRL